MRESRRVIHGRSERAKLLAAEVLEWQALAAEHRYPRSLVDIMWAALRREAEMAAKRKGHP